MKHLDCYENVKNRIGQSDLSRILFPHELKEWLLLTDEAKDTSLQRICTLPLCDEDFTVAYTLYMRLKWLDALKACVPQKGSVVLEVGSGASDNIPNAMTIHDASSKYVTANMNRKLTQGLKQNTADLPLSIKIIEDDANNITKYLAANSVDLVVFEHSVNDVLQAILGEKNGIDTTNSDWFDVLPEMIKIICDEYANQNLAQSVKEPFLSLLSNCMSVLKPGGHLVMSHYMFQYDLDLGYNAELWQNMLPVVRPWLADLSVGKEVLYDGFDPQWWLFYKK